MGKYIKKFDTHSDYEDFIETEDFIKPNVSYCEDNKDVHYNPLPYQGFCKLTLNDGSTVELEGSGELTQAMVSDQYKNTLVSAEIGELCTIIGSNAFNACTSLSNVTIPDSVTSISGGAFLGCSSLASVTIPNNVTSINLSAFYGCSSLTSVTIPNSVTSIGDGAFNGTDALKVLNYNAKCELSTSFRSSWPNLETVIIGDSTPSIGVSAFHGCTGLTSVTIGSGVISIGQGAFQYCSGLTSVTIGNSVTSIGTYAFASCSSLTSITSLAITAPTIFNETFRAVGSNGTLTVPIGSSGYDVWMGTGDYYLGKYNWTKVEQ